MAEQSNGSRVVMRRGHSNHQKEALFDDRADTFCLVTSDSDFAYLCCKLRERGATPTEAETSPIKANKAAQQPVKKSLPQALVDAVTLLSSNTTDGWVGGVEGRYMTAMAHGAMQSKRRWLARSRFLMR